MSHPPPEVTPRTPLPIPPTDVGDVGDDVKALPKVYDCSTCKLNNGLFKIGDREKVKCGPNGLQDVPKGGCGGYYDGSDPLLAWPDVPENYVTPKKWLTHPDRGLDPPKKINSEQQTLNNIT